VNDYIDNIPYVVKHPHPGALFVIFLLESSKIILHCHQSGDDNIAAYGFDGDEMNISEVEWQKKFLESQKNTFPLTWIVIYNRKQGKAS
jgi:hypothetical protein